MGGGLLTRVIRFADIFYRDDNDGICKLCMFFSLKSLGKTSHKHSIRRYVQDYSLHNKHIRIRQMSAADSEKPVVVNRTFIKIAL